MKYKRLQNAHTFFVCDEDDNEEMDILEVGVCFNYNCGFVRVTRMQRINGHVLPSIHLKVT